MRRNKTYPENHGPGETFLRTVFEIFPNNIDKEAQKEHIDNLKVANVDMSLLDQL